MEKRYYATKANVPRSRNDSYADMMAARRILATICRDSAKDKRPSICCTRREVYTPNRCKP